MNPNLDPTPSWHNPDNLPSPGDGKRFLVKGEMVHAGSETWAWDKTWKPSGWQGEDYEMATSVTYRTSASRPLPDESPELLGKFQNWCKDNAEGWLPIASYDRALHGEWVECDWTGVPNCAHQKPVVVKQFSDVGWRDKRSVNYYRPSRFRPIPAQHPVATPPASGETAASTTAIALEIQRYLVSCGLELFQEFREGIERILDQRLAPLENQYAEEAQNAESQRTRELQAALAASRAECEALRQKVAQASDLLLASAEPFDKACAILKS